MSVGGEKTFNIYLQRVRARVCLMFDVWCLKNGRRKRRETLPREQRGRQTECECALKTMMCSSRVCNANRVKTCGQSAVCAVAVSAVFHSVSRWLCGTAFAFRTVRGCMKLRNGKLELIGWQMHRWGQKNLHSFANAPSRIKRSVPVMLPPRWCVWSADTDVHCVLFTMIASFGGAHRSAPTPQLNNGNALGQWPCPPVRTSLRTNLIFSLFILVLLLCCCCFLFFFCSLLFRATAAALCGWFT